MGTIDEYLSEEKIKKYAVEGMKNEDYEFIKAHVPKIMRGKILDKVSEVREVETLRINNKIDGSDDIRKEYYKLKKIARVKNHNQGTKNKIKEKLLWIEKRIDVSEAALRLDVALMKLWITSLENPDKKERALTLGNGLKGIMEYTYGEFGLLGLWILDSYITKMNDDIKETIYSSKEYNEWMNDYIDTLAINEDELRWYYNIKGDVIRRLSRIASYGKDDREMYKERKKQLLDEKYWRMKKDPWGEMNL